MTTSCRPPPLSTVTSSSSEDSSNDSSDEDEDSGDGSELLFKSQPRPNSLPTTSSAPAWLPNSDSSSSSSDSSSSEDDSEDEEDLKPNRYLVDENTSMMLEKVSDCIGKCSTELTLCRYKESCYRLL